MLCLCPDTSPSTCGARLFTLFRTSLAAPVSCEVRGCGSPAASLEHAPGFLQSAGRVGAAAEVGQVTHARCQTLAVTRLSAAQTPQRLRTRREENHADAHLLRADVQTVDDLDEKVGDESPVGAANAAAAVDDEDEVEL